MPQQQNDLGGGEVDDYLSSGKVLNEMRKGCVPERSSADGNHAFTVLVTAG